MSKNIVVCCDGTANEYGDHNTNIVKLFSVLTKDPSKQTVFYDPGVGTFTSHPVMTKIGKAFMKGLGLAFGNGLTENIIDSYRFLMKHYRAGDKVYLFGFSRGSYTARAVAGLIYKCGLLNPDNENLIPYAIQMYKHEKKWEVYHGFKKTFSRDCPIHFMGIWDTVSSVGWVWEPVKLPYTAKNKGISVIRHAISLDERRAFYRQNLMNKPKDDAAQDLKQVWFSGVHSDIGGGYPEGRNALSLVTLEWMLVESLKHGLLVHEDEAKDLVNYTLPLDFNEFIINKSLTAAWWPLEFFPKRIYSFEKKKKQWYFNLGRRRFMHDGAKIHQSVRDRMKTVSDYDPSNLPDETETEPWERLG